MQFFARLKSSSVFSQLIGLYTIVFNAQFRDHSLQIDTIKMLLFGSDTIEDQPASCLSPAAWFKFVYAGTRSSSARRPVTLPDERINKRENINEHRHSFKVMLIPIASLNDMPPVIKFQKLYEVDVEFKIIFSKTLNMA
jgi:hypothetical protein